MDDGVVNLIDAADQEDTVKIVTAAAKVIQAIVELATDLDAVATELKNTSAGDVAAFAGELVERLLEDSIVRYLESEHPIALRVLALLTIVELTRVDTALDSQPITIIRRQIHFDKLGQLIQAPLDFAKTAYGWGSETFDGKLLFQRARDCFESLNLLAAFEDADQDGPAALNLFNLAFTVSKTHPPGIEGEEFIQLGESVDLTLAQINDDWRIALQLSAGFDAGLIVRLLPPASLEVDAAVAVSGDAKLLLLGQSSDPTKPFVIFGESGGSRLQAKQLSVGLIATLKWDAAANKANADVGFEAKFVEGKLIIDTSKSDGFLQKILPSDGITLGFDFDLGWTADRGFFFTGSASLETAFAINLTLGPLELDTLHLLLGVASDKLRLETSLDCKGTLGPIAASVERIGVALDLKFVRGNLGPVDLGIGFKFPAGLGLNIDAGPITGGGFIEFDPDNGRYAGILALSLYGISITAIGLLDTRLPGGKSGFSFLIIIAVKFNAIQLGFGFTLNGVGGLAGINRTMVTEAIQAGIKTHSIDHILFPPDPVRNAPQIISDLRTIFPPAEGRYVFGPMLAIGWGGATSLIEAELGVIIEVPAPVVIAILGPLNMALPTKDAPVVELHLDVLGIIDFGKKVFSIDASLHDSKIVVFTLYGDMAMRLTWGDNPEFLFSIGGWNPHFQAPPNFPALRRLTLGLSEGDELRLMLQTYLAVTSNSFQLGARLEIYIGVSAFNIYGWLGFDALIIFSPFSFIVDFTAGIALRAGDSVIMGISVVGMLSGPTPWHVEGEAHFTIIFFDIGVHVSVTWGQSQTNPLPSVNAWDPLSKAIAAPGSWSGALPPGAFQVVTLAAPDTDKAPVLVEPSGVLTLREKVLPLNQKLSKFGEAIPDQQDEFDLAHVTLGGQPTPFTLVQDNFARGNFQQLSDSDKLTLPSYEPMTAGFSVGQSAVTFGKKYGVDIEFETIIVDSPEVSRRGDRYKLTRAWLVGQSLSGAAANSALRMAGLEKYAPDSRAPKLASMEEEQFIVAGTDDLVVRQDVTPPATKGDAYAALAKHLVANPADRGRLQVVPLHELSEAA